MAKKDENSLFLEFMFNPGNLNRNLMQSFCLVLLFTLTNQYPMDEVKIH